MYYTISIYLYTCIYIYIYTHIQYIYIYICVCRPEARPRRGIRPGPCSIISDYTALSLCLCYLAMFIYIYIYMFLYMYVFILGSAGAPPQAPYQLRPPSTGAPGSRAKMAVSLRQQVNHSVVWQLV